MSDSFNTLRSTFNALLAFPAEDMKKAYKMMGEYAMDGILPDAEESVAYGLFLSIKPLIDRSTKRAAAGRKGAEANLIQHRGTAEANLRQYRGKEEIVKSKEENIKDIKDRHFVPPTLTEVQAYIEEKGYTVDAERFVDFYTSKGWMVGKNKMRDWKSSVRNWARSQREETTAKGRTKEKTGFNNFTQSGTDWDDVAQQIMNKGVI